MLHHPVYAGVYVYGRRCTDPRKQVPGRRGTGRAWAAPADWDVLLRDRLPAYISWEQYELFHPHYPSSASLYQGRRAA
jgi:hypothetical protein